VEATTVVRGIAALAEVVGLDHGVVGTEPLPVDLVEVLRLEHDARNDTLAWRDLHRDIKLAKKDGQVALGRGGVILRLYRVHIALLRVGPKGGSGEGLEKGVVSLGEVGVDNLGAQCLGVRAVIYEGRLATDRFARGIIDAYLSLLGRSR